MAENGTVIKGTSGKIKEIKFPEQQPTPKVEQQPTPNVEPKAETPTPTVKTDTKESKPSEAKSIPTKSEDLSTIEAQEDGDVSETQATVVERDWTGAESFAYYSHLLPILVAGGGSAFRGCPKGC